MSFVIGGVAGIEATTLVLRFSNLFLLFSMLQRIPNVFSRFSFTKVQDNSGKFASKAGRKPTRPTHNRVGTIELRWRFQRGQLIKMITTVPSKFSLMANRRLAQKPIRLFRL